LFLQEELLQQLTLLLLHRQATKHFEKSGGTLLTNGASALLAELDALLRLSDEVGEHGVEALLLEGGKRAERQDFLHAIGAQQNL
jgi:hypothetical protein